VSSCKRVQFWDDTNGSWKVNHNTLVDDLVIRDVQPSDEACVRDVTVAAFAQEEEAGLLDRLRHCGALVLEKVAVNDEGKIQGHVAFSRVTPRATGRGQGLKITCLAPASVWPHFQRQGVGSALIKAALEDLWNAGEDLVLVLGSPTYFPELGFSAELARKIKGPYAGNAFMALALSEAGERDLPIEVAFATPFEAFE